MTDRINDLKEHLFKLRELINGVNKSIEEDGFIPNDNQKNEIDYICKNGKEVLLELKKLEQI